jgi:hypothetical protein
VRLFAISVAVAVALAAASLAAAGDSAFTFYRYQADFTAHTQSFQTWYGGKQAPGNAHIAIDCQVGTTTVRREDKTITEWRQVGGGNDAITPFDTSGYTGQSCVASLLRGGGSNALGTAAFVAP